MAVRAKGEKATFYVDPLILRMARVHAARTGRRDSQVVEEALRAHLGLEALDRIATASALSEEEALELAYAELHAARR